MASATATRMVEAGVSFCFSRLAMNFSKSSMVTRPAAPLPAMPARSAACKPSSSMRAFMRGDMIARARGVGGHGQAAHGRLHAALARFAR